MASLKKLAKTAESLGVREIGLSYGIRFAKTLAMRLRMNRACRSILILLVTTMTLATVCSASAVTTATLENWRATGLNFKFALKTVFSNSSCQENERNFIGCFAAIDAMEHAFETERSAISKAKFEVYTATASRLYQDGPEKTDFENKIEQVRKRLKRVGVSAEAFVCARGINAYYAAVKDPHTRVVPAKDDKVQPTFVGVGVQPQLSERGTVLMPLPNSPAEKAGVRPGDILVGVDGQVAGTVSDEKLIDAIAGKLGTRVNLTVRRIETASDKTVEKVLKIPVTRQRVIRSNVRYEKLELRGVQTAIIAIDTFVKGTCRDVRQLLQNIDRNTSGIIMDLRSNRGGYILEATCISSLFIGADRLAMSYVTSERNKVTTSDIHTSEPQATQRPLVVLVNSDSASASELLAGALQHYERAWLVGERTFGKGSYQEQLKTSLSGLTFSFTGGLYLLPNGRSPQLIGVLPDFETGEKPGPSSENQDEFAREDRFARSIPSTHQAYVRPTNIAQRRAIRMCVQNNHPELEFERIFQRHGTADLQVLTAVDVIKCGETETLSMTKKTVKMLLESTTCSGVAAYFSSLKNQLVDAAALENEIKIRLASDREYFRSLEFYRAQWRLSDLDTSDELASAQSEIMTLASRCHLTTPPFARR